MRRLGGFLLFLWCNVLRSWIRRLLALLILLILYLLSGISNIFNLLKPSLISTFHLLFSVNYCIYPKVVFPYLFEIQILILIYQLPFSFFLIALLCFNLFLLSLAFDISLFLSPLNKIVLARDINHLFNWRFALIIIRIFIIYIKVTIFL